MKKLHFKTTSLKKQLLIGIFSVTISLIALLEISQYYSLKNNLYASKFQLLESRLHNIGIDKLKELNDQNILNKNAESLIDSMIDLDVGVSIIDSNGNLLTDSEENARSSLTNRLLPNKEQKFSKPNPLPQLTSDNYKDLISTEGILDKNLIVTNSFGTRYAIIICKIGDIGNSSGLLQLSTPLTLVDNIIYTQLKWDIAITIIVITIISIMLAKFISFLLKPLNTITSAIVKINDNKLSTRITMDVNQVEIKMLITEFNGMLERLADSFENEKKISDKMRQFVSDASHELRTPLTSIQGFSQLLSSGDITDEDDKNIALNSITNESKRMTRLLNNLLLLTKLDYKVHIEKKPENLKDIVNEICNELKLIAGTRELSIHVEDVWIESNSDQIKQIFINLINNASQHTDKNAGKISIELKNVLFHEIKYAAIIISDNGVGIPKEKLNKIFDRFYRVESHRSRKYGGFGLGLSIVKSIVDENHGKIQVESKSNHGSKFTIYFKAIDYSQQILS